MASLCPCFDFVGCVLVKVTLNFVFVRIHRPLLLSLMCYYFIPAHPHPFLSPDPCPQPPAPSPQAPSKDTGNGVCWDYLRASGREERQGAVMTGLNASPGAAVGTVMALGIRGEGVLELLLDEPEGV